MRYYKFAVSGKEEKIKKLLQDKEYLREYRWDGNVICAVNSYMYRNLKNDIGVLAYRRETDDKILAVFSWMKNERLWKLRIPISTRY